MNDSKGASGVAVIRGSVMPVESAAIQVRIPACAGNEKPTIKINQENDVIRSIEVTCCCGKTVELVCEYANDLEQAAEN